MFRSFFLNRRWFAWSILGTVLGAMIFSTIISGFTSIRLDAYYQEMVKGAIIVGAVVLDQWRQRKRTRG